MYINGKDLKQQILMLTHKVHFQTLLTGFFLNNPKFLLLIPYDTFEFTKHFIHVINRVRLTISN